MFIKNIWIYDSQAISYADQGGGGEGGRGLTKRGANCVRWTFRSDAIF